MAERNARSPLQIVRDRHQLDVAAAVRQPHTEITRRQYAAEHRAEIAVIAFRMEPGLRRLHVFRPGPRVRATRSSRIAEEDSLEPPTVGVCTSLDGMFSCRRL